MVFHLAKSGSQNLDEMGLGGSVWIHIEAIRRCTVDLEIDNLIYGTYILQMCSETGSRFWDGSEEYKVHVLKICVQDMELRY